MTRVSRRPLRALTVCGLVLVSQALIVSVPTTSSDTSCTALRRRAQPYAHRTLTLDQIARFDPGQRRAIFNAITPTVRASLWREQLRRFSERADLTTEQRIFVREEIAALAPHVYERPLTTRREDARQLWARAAPLFPRREHQRAWFDLGAVVETPRAAQATAIDRLLAPFRAQAQYPYCECAFFYGPFECYPGGCVSAPEGCEMWQGCGPEGRHDCVGVCTTS